MFRVRLFELVNLTLEVSSLLSRGNSSGDDSFCLANTAGASKLGDNVCNTIETKTLNDTIACPGSKGLLR